MQRISQLNDQVARKHQRIRKKDTSISIIHSNFSPRNTVRCICSSQPEMYPCQDTSFGPFIHLFYKLIAH